jgi:hypothetical protein
LDVYINVIIQLKYIIIIIFSFKINCFKIITRIFNNINRWSKKTNIIIYRSNDGIYWLNERTYDKSVKILK